MNKITTWASIGCAFTTTFLYYVMVYTSLDQGLKWYLFRGHLLIAIVGMGFSLTGLFKKNWVCFLSLVICGYFLVIQLGGL